VTALPIDPTGADLRPLWYEDGAPVIKSEFEAAWLRIFQAGVEAERARAAAEATEEWGFNDGAGMIHGGMTYAAAGAFIQRDRRRSIVCRTVGPWESAS
jgi:hypothetical protein